MKKFQKLKSLLALCLICSMIFSSCNSKDSNTDETNAKKETWRDRPVNVIDDKYRTYYEIFVYSFYDSDDDGIGDLNGVTEKLDYLADLGVNGIWLMPIMPSTTYHKYDTTDYMSIDKEYGTMEDFDKFIEACHQKGINVIIDLAMNHSSSQHPWFLEAVKYIKSLPEGASLDSNECKYVNYYNFTKEYRSGHTQIKGTEWYYESQFWSEMPDLNLTNEDVRKEFEEIAKFWLDKGVDGFRLDAVKEFVSGNIASNTDILKWFNDYTKSINPDTYIVCECWMDQISYSQYYQSGVDSMFNFHFANNSGVISNVVNGKSAASLYGKSLVSSAEIYASYNPNYIDAPFYTNHDLARSAGYYAGDNSEAQTKIGHALNLLMTGNAFIYYGEELGMKGSGIDENKRAPMYWSKDANATGMCDGPAGMKSFKMKFDSFAEQKDDSNSIYNYVKDTILIRNQNPEIARGTVTFYEEVSNQSICVISKKYNDKEVLLAFNISAESHDVSLDAISINGKKALEQDVLGTLLTGTEDVKKTDTGYTMPAYSVMVLGVK